MSRARAVGGLWFDANRNHEKATSGQLELLAIVEDLDLDDLLDEGLRQLDVVLRLRLGLGEGAIPSEVLERKRQARLAALHEPACRICSTFGEQCEGGVTRHHFVPRWMMLMLENYVSYAARSRCTIPVCTGRHRDLHLRDDDYTPKSMSQFMTYDERRFAQKMLDEFKEQHPRVFDLILGGDSEASYEAQLIQDYTMDEFTRESSREEVETQIEEWRLFQAIG